MARGQLSRVRSPLGCGVAAAGPYRRCFRIEDHIVNVDRILPGKQQVDMLQGLGKAIARCLVHLRLGDDDFERVKSIFVQATA